MRAIDADELKKKAFGKRGGLIHTADIDAMPTIESERKTGKWIRPFDAQASSYRYQCSVCGRTAYQVTGNCGRKHKVSQPPCTYKYCPNCGADMKGAEKE